MSSKTPDAQQGKHRPCLLSQYIQRVGKQLSGLCKEDEIDENRFRYECIQEDRLFEGSGKIWTQRGIIRIDAEEWLTVVDQTASGLWVKRKHYNYHATLTHPHGEPGNICRFESPDRHVPDGAPSHHESHHLHHAWPFSEQEEQILELEEDQTPTLPEVVRYALSWQRRHYTQLEPILAET